MKKLSILGIVILVIHSCTVTVKKEEAADEETFSFVFMTDIHLMPERHAIEGYGMAIEEINDLGPDFVISGGDLVDDVLEASYGRADTLFNLLTEMNELFHMPVYNAMGNHDHYGYSREGADPEDPDWGEGMFERRIGPRYQSFDHKGWHFMILDDIELDTGSYSDYYAEVDQEQLDWIVEDLAEVDPETPIAIVSHIPLVSIFPQVRRGALNTRIRTDIVVNQVEVLAPFREKNLRLVLQGHVHAIEELILMEQVHFITGGAVCGLWWRTPDDSEFQEGFVKVDVSGDDFSWEYVDYGWETGTFQEE